MPCTTATAAVAACWDLQRHLFSFFVIWGLLGTGKEIFWGLTMSCVLPSYPSFMVSMLRSQAESKKPGVCKLQSDFFFWGGKGGSGKMGPAVDVGGHFPGALVFFKRLLGGMIVVFVWGGRGIVF